MPQTTQAKPNSRQFQGTIVCRLDEVMLRASQRWGWRVTASRIAQATRGAASHGHKPAGLNVKTVLRLASNKTTLYDQHTLAVLCWYFGCQVGDLLEYVPPGCQRTPVPLEHIKRERPPDGPPPLGLALDSHIAAVIAEHNQNAATIARLAGVKWDTLVGHTREQHRSRIASSTLLVLCETLAVRVEKLFSCCADQGVQSV